LEFSFDRSRESSARRPDSQTQSQPQNNSQQSAAPKPGPDLNSVDPSTVANERLRKAIERNRAKQAERDAGRPASVQQQAAPRQPEPQQQGSFFSQSSHLSQDDQAHIAQQEALREAHRVANMEAMRAREEQLAQKQAEYAQYAQQAQQAANSEREEHREQMRQEAKQQAPQMPPEAPSAATEAQSPRARLRARMAGAAKVAEANGAMNNENVDTTPMPSKGTSVVSRRSVAKPEDTEFVPVKRTPKKVASQISYTTASTRKKQKSMDPKYVNWLVKGSWIFCGLMVLRLIFATGGVTDFYSQKGAVADRVAELGNIKKENMQLVREIERMRSDAGFQKKLVRDNLGFIAADEFLVLFPK
jgi:cell division protein FtsB